MDITSSANIASALSSTAQSQNAVQLRVLNKALNTQVAGAIALIQSLPTPTPPPTAVTPGSSGGLINTWA